MYDKIHHKKKKKKKTVRKKSLTISVWIFSLLISLKTQDSAYKDTSNSILGLKVKVKNKWMKITTLSAYNTCSGGNYGHLKRIYNMPF